MQLPWPTSTNPFAYLASPYSLYPHGRDRAVEDVALIAATLIHAGVQLFCPVAHSALLVRAGIPPLDGTLWARINAPFLGCCSVLILARMDGWRESSGIAAEVDFFERHAKPIYDLYPATMQMTRRVIPLSRKGIPDEHRT